MGRNLIIFITKHLITLFVCSSLIARERALALPHSSFSRKETLDSFIPNSKSPQQEHNALDHTKQSPRRAVDISIQVATSEPKDYYADIDDESVASSPQTKKKKKKTNTSITIKPAYPCDEWHPRTKTCWLDRNIGETVTLVLSISEGAHPNVEWSQILYMKGGGKSSYTIDPEFPPWNIVIGSKGHEMRISPITEIDIDNNAFSALVPGKSARLSFRFRVLPINIGYVYPGETLMFNMKRVNLPPQGMTYVWHLEKDGESGSLPSNMKLSPGGEVISVTELRTEQKGILACSVYTNQGIFATKMRFKIENIAENDNMLIFQKTRKPHQEIKHERRKREIQENVTEDNFSDDENGLESLFPAFDSADSDSITQKVIHSRKRRQVPVELHDDAEENYKENLYSSLQDLSNKELLHPVENQYLDKDEADEESLSQPTQESPLEANAYESKSSENDLVDKANSDQNISQADVSKDSQLGNDKSEVANSNFSNVSSGRSYRQTNLNTNYNGVEPNVPNTENQNTANMSPVPILEKEKYSRLLSTCSSDMQCNNDAYCAQSGTNVGGFCNCLDGFQGNGIFCWKSIKI